MFHLRAVLISIFALALLVRITIRDSIALFSTFYYSTPWPVLALIVMAIGLLWLKHDRRLFLISSLTSLAILSGWVFAATRHGFVSKDMDGYRIFFWNTARGRFGVAKVIEQVRQADADIVGIVEAGLRKPANRVAWRQGFRQQKVFPLEGDMVCITKGELVHRHSGDLGGRGKYNLLKIRLKESTLSLLLVDIEPYLFSSRGPAFVVLEQIIRGQSGERLIVMGDFNTPIESIYFDSFRQTLSNVFEESGSGFEATWPVPFPVLTIDHIWMSKNIEAIDCYARSTQASDHRSITAKVKMPEAAEAEAGKTDSYSPTLPASPTAQARR